jgi:hypothetical protein
MALATPWRQRRRILLNRRVLGSVERSHRKLSPHPGSVSNFHQPFGQKAVREDFVDWLARGRTAYRRQVQASICNRLTNSDRKSVASRAIA